MDLIKGPAHALAARVPKLVQIMGSPNALKRSRGHNGVRWNRILQLVNSAQKR